jgi:hypothetical protein
MHNWSISAIPDQTPKKWSSFRTEEDVNSRGGVLAQTLSKGENVS